MYATKTKHNKEESVGRTLMCGGGLRCAMRMNSVNMWYGAKVVGCTGEVVSGLPWCHVAYAVHRIPLAGRNIKI
jgi:hypothetical protein